MCKIVVVPKITDETRETAKLFVEGISEFMSKVDDDGFGYAAINTEGKLFGERWHKNREAFKERHPLTDTELNILRSFKGVLSKDIKYNTFGAFHENNNMKAITLHARMATTGKIFQNTHPFVEKFTSVIHNGVITNHDKLCKKYSSCDSEVILHEYIKNDVANNPKNIQRAVNKFEGYYACAVFSRMKDGTVILDIFKDGKANLGAIYVNELESVVIATDTDHIERTCTQLGLTAGPKFEFKPGQLLRFNVATGEVISKTAFDPYFRQRAEKELEKKAKVVSETNGNQKCTAVTVTDDDVITGDGERPGLRVLPGLPDDMDWICDPHSKVWKKIRV